MRYMFMVISLIFFVSCSKIIEGIWNPDASEFEIEATDGGSNQIVITFNRSDHSSVRSSGDIDDDEYFWGYYIYRNSSSPYDDFSLVGIEAQSNCTGDDGNGCFHSGYVEMHGTSQQADIGGQNNFIDVCPVSGTTYYYRVVAVTRDYDPDVSTPEWESGLNDEAASSWTSLTCP